jgi:hypothetical protein
VLNNFRYNEYFLSIIRSIMTNFIIIKSIDFTPKNSSNITCHGDRIQELSVCVQRVQSHGTFAHVDQSLSDPHHEELERVLGVVESELSQPDC